MQAVDIVDAEIERRLDSYARARLSPDPRSTARVRARVMREARLHVQAVRVAAHIEHAHAPRRSPGRRLALSLLAAAVWMAIAVGTISAAQAGGPLYPARMWLESATLPAAGSARASADIERLEARVAEVLAAAAGGDAGAVRAALAAYRQIADDAVGAIGGDEALQTLVATALGRHSTVLAAVADGLAERGNTTAADAVGVSLERAIETNRAVIERLTASGAGWGGQPAGAGAGVGASGGNGSSGSTDSGGQPGGGPGSGADKPDRTPKPTAKPAGPPDATPRGPRH